MSTPSPSWNAVRVYGTWHNLDGTLKAGTYSVTVPVRVTNAPDDVIIPRGTTQAPLSTTGPKSLDTGAPSTNDPDNLPNNGWQLIIRVDFTDRSDSEVYVIDVPVGGPDIDLRTLVPISPTASLPTPSPVWVIGGPGGLAQYSAVPQVVFYGTNPNLPRPPGAVLVFWIGDPAVDPVHAADPDVAIPYTGPDPREF